VTILPLVKRSGTRFTLLVLYGDKTTRYRGCQSA
jgi:hypothetical protein